MHSRAASLLEHEGDVGWLTGPAPCNAYHHMMHRLFNIFVTREEMRLDIEIAEKEKVTSEREKIRLNPNAKPFQPKGIKTQHANLQNNIEKEHQIQSVATEWVQTYRKNKSNKRKPQLDVNIETKQLESSNRFSALAEKEEHEEDANDLDLLPATDSTRRVVKDKTNYDVDEIPVAALDELIEGCMKHERKADEMMHTKAEISEHRQINEIEVDVSRSLHRMKQKDLEEENERINELLASCLAILEQKASNEEVLTSEVCQMRNELKACKEKLERTEKALKVKTDALIKHLNRDKVEVVKKVKRPKGYKAHKTF